MSAYLSPILSSGDSTPAENLACGGQSVPLMVENCKNIGVDYPMRKFKVQATTQQLQQQQQQLADLQSGHTKPGKRQSSEKRKKTNRKLRAMGSSMLNDSSDEDEQPNNENSFPTDEDDDNSDDDDDEYQSDRLRFTANLQNYLRNKPPSSSQNKNSASAITQSQAIHQHHQQHQCLADQFLSMTARGSNGSCKDEHNSTTRSSFISSDSELFNNPNSSNNNNNQNQFRKLFRSAASNQQRLNKKFKQIIQSIPVVPLVATTSIMTIVLLCLLLLSDSLHLATALRSNPTATMVAPSPDDQQQHKQQSPLIMGGGDDDGTGTGSNMDHQRRHHHNNQQQQQQHHHHHQKLAEAPQMQSLVMETKTGPAEVEPSQEAGLDESLLVGEQQRRPGGTPPRILSLRRELIGNILAQQQQQQHHHQQQHKEMHHASDKRHVYHHLASQQHQTTHELRPKIKRRQQQVPENVGLFDSLGAMMFGAASQQKQQQPGPTDDPNVMGDESEVEPSDLQLGDSGGDAERLPGGSIDGAASADQLEAGHASFMLDGEPHASPALSSNHRPAHLRSSTIELEMMGPEATTGPMQRNQNKQLVGGRSSNSVSSLLKQQQQHVGKHPHHQNESPTMMLMDRRGHQHQQHQQQQQSASDSTMADNEQHERKFDVPQIACNNTDEGFERFACPTPDELGRYRCIEDRLFCDGYNDCPQGEDEERVSCMYYRLFVSHIDILTNTFLTWMKSQNRQAANNINNNQHHHKQQSHLIGELDA